MADKAVYLKSAFRPADFPGLPHPEFAVMGRSNVGKSSFLNMLTGVRGLVKVGAKPGVTKSVNFFILEGRITLVDLPGFGYAKLPMELKKQFLPLIKSYISARDRIRLVFLLIDIRREPGDFEREMIALLTERGIPIAIVATKCDKFSRGKRLTRRREIASALDIGVDSVFLSSAETGEGKKELLGLIKEYAITKDKDV
ncbi:MAG: YihA family ribosome biogenesis GTP-binding protein [Spirochaetes bacterium]|nr:MAG: YihA family ribosome biogenesis GTP-binding protein [Spirochaetota bacterium]